MEVLYYGEEVELDRYTCYLCYYLSTKPCSSATTAQCFCLEFVAPSNALNFDEIAHCMV